MKIHPSFRFITPPLVLLKWRRRSVHRTYSPFHVLQREIGECSFAPSRKLIRILRRRILPSYRSTGDPSVSSYRAYLPRSSFFRAPGFQFQDLTRYETRAKQKGVCEPVIRDSGVTQMGKARRLHGGEKVRDRRRRRKKTERQTGNDISLLPHPCSRIAHDSSF